MKIEREFKMEHYAKADGGVTLFKDSGKYFIIKSFILLYLLSFMNKGTTYSAAGFILFLCLGRGLNLNSYAPRVKPNLKPYVLHWDTVTMTTIIENYW